MRDRRDTERRPLEWIAPLEDRDAKSMSDFTNTKTAGNRQLQELRNADEQMY